MVAMSSEHILRLNWLDTDRRLPEAQFTPSSQTVGASISTLRTAIGAVPLGFEDRLHQLGEAMSLSTKPGEAQSMKKGSLQTLWCY